MGKEWVKRIILTLDKTMVTGDYLIDDKPHITGCESSPTWTHILYDQPYNKEVNKPRIVNWTQWREIIN